MKKSILLLLFVSCFLNIFSQEQTTTETATTVVKEKAEEVVAKKMETSSDSKIETTTFYLISNGETKPPSDKYPDPYLTETGEKKAKNWVKILADIKFGAIYAQELTSAKQTAQTVATSQKIGIYALDTKNIYDNSFKYNTNGKNVLVAGDNAVLAYFANTVLGHKKYTTSKTVGYSDFYIVTVTKDFKNAIKLNVE